MGYEIGEPVYDEPVAPLRPIEQVLAEIFEAMAINQEALGPTVYITAELRIDPSDPFPDASNWPSD